MDITIIALVVLALGCGGRLYFSKHKGIQIYSAFEALAIAIVIITTQLK